MTLLRQAQYKRQHIPMSSPDITAAEIEAVNRVLQTPYLSIGPRIDEFEERFAAYVGARHAVGVSSGTAGLHLCAIAASISESDLVITTPFSFVASANVILYQRAIPIFVDIDPHTLNLDPALVAEAVHNLTRGQGEGGTRRQGEGGQGDKGRGDKETRRQGDKETRGRSPHLLLTQSPPHPLSPSPCLPISVSGLG